MAENQINGTENNDLLLDTPLEDEIFALGGNDEIETTEGSDIIYGDAGIDTLTFNYGDHNGDLNINLSNYDSFNGDGSVYIDSYSSNYFTNNINFYSIEKLKLIGGDGNDSLGSYSYNNIVSDETIEGGAGDDYISPGKGFDVVDGGSGYDILDLDLSTSINGITSSLSNNNSGEYIGSDSAVEFSNIEAVAINGSFYDDTLVVPTEKNNGTYSAFIPFINGGDGFDEIVVDLSSSNEDLYIEDSTGLRISPDYINELSTDSIESYNITSGRGNDEIRLEEFSYGDYRDDVINAGAGNDTISIANGYDIVDGGSGYDILNIGYNFSYSPSRITSSLSDSNSGEYTSNEGTVEFSNIEAVSIYGSYEDDILAVPIGKDNPTGFIPYIDGGDGFDELVINLSDRNSSLIIDNSSGLNINYSNNSNHLDVYSIEGFNITTGRGDDDINLNLDGTNYSDDTVNAGAGDDFITTGKGFDVVDGGSGFDVLNLDFSSKFNSGVTSSLSDGNSGEYISDEGTVEFTNIESVNVIGSQYDDVLVAPIKFNPLMPTGSYINGGNGFDELVIDYSDNNRNFDFNLDSYGSLNIFDYQTGNNEYLLGFSEVESFNITTGRGNNNINLNSNLDNYSDDTVNAGAGDDFITTGKGFDVVDGGSGFDVLNLDFSSNFNSGVTSSLNGSNSGEYISDEGTVEFVNIESVNVIGSQYDDVLAAPLNSNPNLPISSYVNGGSGFDELVVDYSDNNRDFDLNLESYGNLNVYDYQTSNNEYLLSFNEIESFNITTGRGDNNINLNYNLDNYTDDIVNAGAGDDFITTGKGFDVVDGGSGFDVLNLDFSSNFNSGVTSSLNSSNSGEYISDEGTVGFVNIESVNVIGSFEDDLLHGLKGQDTIYGELGADSLLGGLGADLLNGGIGIDTIRGGDDNDIIAGNEDNDSLFGDAGDDIIEGGLGNDSLKGGDDNDILLGGLGIDTIRGEAGNDLISGNDERDLLFGNAGNDTIEGGLGDDFLRGGDDDDILFGGEGKDVLFGEDGADIFVLESNYSPDFIKDFNNGEDRFGLTSGLNFSDLSITNNALGSATVIRNADNNDVIANVIGIDSMEITIEDFVNI